MLASVSIISRSAMPSNLVTVGEWRKFGKKALNGRTWENAAKWWAAEKGGSFVMLADDSLRVYTRMDDGKIRQHTFKPGAWKWGA